MDRSFPRSERVGKSAEFRRVFDRGRSASDGRLIVYALPREEGLPSRLGLVVNRRFGNSPTRNQFKRRVREAFRTNKDRLPSSHDLLVLPARPGQVPGFEEIEASLILSADRAVRAYATRGPKSPKARRT